jgi:hypothetical protein
MRGTDDVLEMNVGSEIMPLVTDLFRCPSGVPLPSIGVERPSVVGYWDPTGDGRADDGVGGKPGDRPGVKGLIGDCGKGGLGEGLGGPPGIRPPFPEGAFPSVGVLEWLSKYPDAPSRASLGLRFDIAEEDRS